MTIVFCLPGRMFSGKFLQSWTILLNHCIRKNINIVISQHYNPNVYYVRSQCLGGNVLAGIHQKPWQGQLKYDYSMWIDSDMVFTPDQFEKLLSYDKDIVSGIYYTEDKVHFTAVQDWDTEYFQKTGTFKFLELSDVADKTELMEIAYNGMGFMLIKNGVFESIQYPWFEPRRVELSNNIEDFASEDVSFCLKAREAGYKIYIDPTMIVGHEKLQIIQ